MILLIFLYQPFWYNLGKLAVNYKTNTMKKFFAIACIAVSLVACKENETKEEKMEETIISTPTTAPMATEGDFMMQDNKVMVMKNGSWVAVTEPMTLPNGTVVMANGEVKNKDGVTITIAEGQRLNNEGVVVEGDGDNILDDAAGGVKKGLNEAGDAISTGAEKTGEAVSKGVQKAGEGIKKGAKEVKEAIVD